jgi:hypothetical protein
VTKHHFPNSSSRSAFSTKLKPRITVQCNSREGLGGRSSIFDVAKQLLGLDQKCTILSNSREQPLGMSNASQAKACKQRDRQASWLWGGVAGNIRILAVMHALENRS